MFTKRCKLTSWVLVCTILLSLLVAQTAVAQSPTGGGPDEAMSPSGEWKEIQSGQQHWYLFHFAYDEKWSDRPVEIRLYTEPIDGAVLTIRNEEQAQIWRRDGKNEHFGCCSPVDVDRNSDGMKDYALWSGVLRESGNYYMVVEHARNISQPVRYRFEITGSGLTFPGTVTQPAPRAVPPVELQSRVASTLPGTGPDYALAPTDAWLEIKPGEHHWYAFNYGYDAKRDNPVIEIKLWSEPYNGAMLSLRNEQQANLWRKDGKHEWFGCTTPAGIDRDNNGNPDYGFWAGALRISGRYYMVVEHNGDVSGSVYYRIAMSGQGFSFPTAAPMQPVTAPAAAAAPVAPAPVAVTGLTGTGPDYAMRPTSAWTTIGEGQYHWYAFHFGYDEKLANQPITIRMYTEPNEAATLTVRDAEQADLWRREGKHVHFGCCTPFFEDLDKDGRSDYALWSGALRESGTYYIVIEHDRSVSGPVQYSFTIEGTGVSF